MDLSSRELWRVPKVHGSWDAAVEGFRSLMFFWFRALFRALSVAWVVETSPDPGPRFSGSHHFFGGFLVSCDALGTFEVEFKAGTAGDGGPAGEK